jgi:hypothetical protein
VQEQLVNAKDGAKLYFVRGNMHSQKSPCMCLLRCDPGAQGCLGVVPECASIANRVFASFLARLPPARSDPLPPHPARLDDALERLAEIVDDPDIRSREACSPMAFSCVPPVVVRRRTQIYARAALGHRCAFSPLDYNGRPKRKYVLVSTRNRPSGVYLEWRVPLRSRYSERVQEEWFEIDRNWISHSGMCVSPDG